MQKTASDLPNGTVYAVKETDYTADGYQTASTNASGKIVGNTAGDNTVTASFINNRG